MVKWGEVDALTDYLRPMSWYLEAEKFDFVGRLESFAEDVAKLELLSGQSFEGDTNHRHRAAPDWGLEWRNMAEFSNSYGSKTGERLRGDFELTGYSERGYFPVDE